MFLKKTFSKRDTPKVCKNLFDFNHKSIKIVIEILITTDIYMYLYSLKSV